MCLDLQMREQEIRNIKDAETRALEEADNIGLVNEYVMNSNSDLLSRKRNPELAQKFSQKRRDTLKNFWTSAYNLVRFRNDIKKLPDTMTVKLNERFKTTRLAELQTVELTEEEHAEALKESQSSIKSLDSIEEKKLKAKKKELKKNAKANYDAYLEAHRAGEAKIIFADDDMIKTLHFQEILRQTAYTGPKYKYSKEDHEEEYEEKHEYSQEEMLEVVQNGDYSHMEQMDIVLRNVAASEYMRNLEVPEHTNAESFIESLMKVEELDIPRRKNQTPSEQTKGGIKELMNPLLRIGLSLCISDPGYVRAFPQFAKSFGTVEKVRALEAKINARIMAETISTIPDIYAMNADDKFLPELDMDKKREAIVKSVEQNRKAQIFMAKNMLAAQLGKFTKKTNDGESAWSGPVANAFAHCSRVGIILPGKTGAEYSDKNRDATTNAFAGANKGKGAGFKSRFSATHAIKTKAKNQGRKFEEKKKKWGWIFGQYGMNVAIGGLGNDGLGGFNGRSRKLNNDGSCGHIYMHIEDGDKSSYTGMLIGFESDQPGFTNQLGHTHGAGNPEFASSFGGQRLDEIGYKYGGRVIDLSEIDEKAFQITMTGMEKLMENLLTSQKSEDMMLLKSISEMLCGNRLSFRSDELRNLVKLCVTMSPLLDKENIEDIVGKVLVSAAK